METSELSFEELDTLVETLRAENEQLRQENEELRETVEEQVETIAKLSGPLPRGDRPVYLLGLPLLLVEWTPI